MGMLSAALGAGGGAVAERAKGLIDSETRVNAEKELMAAREQMELRVREAQEQLRRGGNAYDFDVAGKNQPEVLRREDVAARGKHTRDSELALDSAKYRKAHPELGEAERDIAANKEPPGQADLRGAQADYYRGGGAAGSGEKVAIATSNSLLKGALALENSGDMAGAQALRAQSRAVLAGVMSRQTGEGKGPAAQTYPAISQAQSDLLNKRLREKPKDASLIISAFEKTYGPGSADALIE